jgi:hypothetical protein
MYDWGIAISWVLLLPAEYLLGIDLFFAGMIQKTVIMVKYCHKINLKK